MIEHSLLTALDEARVAVEEAKVAHHAGKIGYGAVMDAERVLSLAVRDLRAAGGCYYDWADLPSDGDRWDRRRLRQIGAIDGEIYNPHAHPIDEVEAVLAAHAAEAAVASREAELRKPNESVAEAFRRATRRRSWLELSGIFINVGGSITCKADRPPEETRALAIRLIDEIAPLLQRESRLAAEKAALTRALRKARLGTIGEVEEK